MRVAIYTLGCKVNQYETQAMEAELTRRGHALVPFDGAADAYVINTCTVTAVSDKKSRQMIRQARKRSPHAVVAVCGCYAQTDPEAVEALGVDLVMGTADRMGFLDALEALSPDGGHPVVRVDDALRRRQYEHLPPAAWRGAPGPCSRWRTAASTSAPTVLSPTPGGRSAPFPWGRPPVRQSALPGRATGSWCSPASKSPPGDTISKMGRA